MAEAAEKATSSSDDLKDKDLLIAKLLRKTNKTSGITYQYYYCISTFIENQSKSFSIGIQFDYTVHLLGKRCSSIMLICTYLLTFMHVSTNLGNFVAFGMTNLQLIHQFFYYTERLVENLFDKWNCFTFGRLKIARSIH